MNWDQIEGNWKQFTGRMKERWGEFTDDELDQVEGNREQLEGKIQEKYGKSKEEARDEVEQAARGARQLIRLMSDPLSAEQDNGARRRHGVGPRMALGRKSPGATPSAPGGESSNASGRSLMNTMWDCSLPRSLSTRRWHCSRHWRRSSRCMRSLPIPPTSSSTFSFCPGFCRRMSIS